MAVTVGWIYGIVNPITNELRYIGQTVNFNKRKSEHLYRAKTLKSSWYLYNWLNSMLSNNIKPEFIIVDEVPIESLDYWEIFYISYFKSIGCNLTNYASGGNSRGGYNHTQEFKDYLSNKYKGRKPWNIGKKLSKEHKENISKNHKSPDKNLLYKWEVARSKQKVVQYSLNNEVIKEWDSAYEASKYLNINRKSIGNVLANRAKTAGKYKWRYKKKGE